MCQMSISLKAKTHINTIHNVHVITPHGARQKFGMIIFVHEITSAWPPDHLTPFSCLLSHMNQLPHHLPIISASSQDKLPLLQPHLCHDPIMRFRHLTSYNAYTPPGLSRTVSLQLPILMLPYPYLILSTPYHD
ncbi:hypothetical protein O181_015876 [Austropuccinia psidii MF-1]|uniref:Uncharacterized protein n=1 Tax=Austropuccinia psidii MF-1 TaxID=1389203 RepID=A0A9Q3C0N9_9BASI|nr:hypothetical protein [Austropuccinia psidii MF-1]